MYALRRFSKLLKRSFYEALTAYQTSDEHRGHTNHHMSKRVKVRQKVSKRLKARQMCVDDNEHVISKKPPL